MKSKPYYLKLATIAVLLFGLCTFTAYERRHEIWSAGQLHWGRALDTYFPFLLCGAIFPLFIFLVNPYLQTRVFRKGIACQRDYSYTIDGSGIALHTIEVDASIKWTLFDYLTDSPDGFVVPVKKTNAFDWLPKTGFDSDADYERCRDILRSNVQMRKV